MARNRAEEKQPKKSFFSNQSIKYIIIAIIIIFIIIFGGIYALTTSEDKPNSNSNDNPGKWLFAMDTDNIQLKYNAQAIPTLLIIDKDGNIVYYNRGASSKDQLMPYINSALKGTAESIQESIDFTVNTFNNEKFTLSEHKGEVILIDIMGLGCPPCKTQMPELHKIKKELGEDITILSVDVSYMGETAKDVMETYGEYIKR
jgi:cytochrome oxidase Cu insertion factor (SCO1/SenC/PrrC family)